MQYRQHYIQYHPALHAVPPALHTVPPSTTYSTTQHYMQYHPALHAVLPALHAVPPNATCSTTQYTYIFQYTITNLSNFSTVDPVVISDPIGANITLFTSHMISCEARGSPQPIIVWYRNGSLINYQTARGLSVSVTTIHVVVHSELRFLNATFEYSGVYWCEARPIHLGGTPASSARVNITVQSTFKLIAIQVYCVFCVYVY